MKAPGSATRFRFWFGYWLPSILVGMVARMFRRRQNPQGIGCIVVLLPEHIGDVVMTSPLLRFVQRQFPTAKLVACVSPVAAPLLTPCPCCRTVVCWPDGAWAAWRVGWGLRRLRPDLVIVPRADPDQRWAPLVAVLSGAPRRISLTDAATFSTRLKRLQSEPFYSETVRPEPTIRHERLRRLEIARRLGAGAPASHLESWVSATDEARAAAFAATLPATGQRVALGLGASAAARVWPAERFAQLIDRLNEVRAIVPVLITGPREAALVEAVRAATRTPVHCMSGATLGESVALLRHCALFVGNDSGPAHLASSVGLPIVVISAHPEGAPPDHPNSPAKCGPSGEVTCVVRPSEPLDPDCFGGCGSDKAHCILGVSVEAVVVVAANLQIRRMPSSGEALAR